VTCSPHRFGQLNGRLSTDLQGDSRVANVVVGPGSAKNPQKHRTGEDEQNSDEAERLGVQPAISHEPTLGLRAPLRLPRWPVGAVQLDAGPDLNPMGFVPGLDFLLHACPLGSRAA
jgi:hypothetical protein